MRRRRPGVGAFGAAVRAMVLLATWLALIQAGRAPQPPPEGLTVLPGERLLVIAPHPDDETLGAGGLIQRVLAQHGEARVVLVTAGDGNVGGVVLETGLRQPPPANFVAYGERRVDEARAAMTALGAQPLAVDLLGFPDGGLMPLLSQHWWRAHPARSATTGASEPPYPSAINPDVAYDGADLRDTLVRALEQFRPTLIALPDPLDRHLDHRAAGVFSILAVDEWIGGRWPRRDAPRVLAYLVHWPDWPPGWDATAPTPADAERPLPLPARGLETPTLELTPAEVAGKATGLGAHRSQQHAMGTFLAAFVRRTEPFTLLDTAAVRRIGLEYEREEQRVSRPSSHRAG